jgi:hypothetical protein
MWLYEMNVTTTLQRLVEAARIYLNSKQVPEMRANPYTRPSAQC